MRIVGILFALVLTLSLVLVPAAVFAQDSESCCANGNSFEGLNNCEWDQIKWAEWPYQNVNSWHLYLQHWGRTPVTAMSRLSGLCGPDTLCAQLGTNCPTPGASTAFGDPNTCLGGCATCRDVEPGCLACCDDPVNCTESCCATGSCGELEAPSCPTPVSGGCPADVVIAGKLPKCCCCWGVSLAFASKSWAAATIGPQASLNDNHLNHFGTSDCCGGNHGGDWGLSGCPHTECCTMTWCLQDNCFSSNNCN